MAYRKLTGVSYAQNTSFSTLSGKSDKQSSGVQKMTNFVVAAVFTGANLASPYVAQAQDVTIKFEDDTLACTASAAKEFASLDASITEKAANGFDPVKLEKMRAKRQELLERNIKICIETVAANRKAAEADARIAEADAQIAQSRARIAEADARLARVAYIQSLEMKMDPVIKAFDTFLKGGKASGDLKKLQDMIAQTPNFAKDARAYVEALKPILMEYEGGAKQYELLDMKVRRIETLVNPSSQKH